METMGDRIKKNRKKLKLTQQQLADKLNKSKSTIQKYESGDVGLSAESMKALCDIFNIDLYELVIGEKNKSKNSTKNKLSEYFDFIHEILLKKFIDTLSSISNIKADVAENYYYSLLDLFQWDLAYDPSSELLYIAKFPATDTIVVHVEQFILLLTNIILLEENFFKFSHKSSTEIDDIRYKLINMEIY